MVSPSSATEIYARFLAGEGQAYASFDDLLRAHPGQAEQLRRLREDHSHLGGVLGQVFHRSREGTVPEPPGHDLLSVEEGTTLGEFRLVRLLGAGGMGQVWEAHQASLDRLVALKLIRPDSVTDRALSFFEREARAGARLKHPGLVAVYATGVDRGLPWIAQELVEEGATLRDFLDQARERDELPRNYFVHVARLYAHMAGALKEAHTKGVVHRDIKPQNVLITRDDVPKIGDFGLARLMDEVPISDPFSIRGTPQYMSPEQASGRAREVDHRTDVFSLGAMLYETLTLAPPFRGKSPTELLHAIVHTDPLPPRERRASVPEDLEVICLRCLEKRPADRFQTMAALGDELDRFLHHEPIQSRPPSLPTRVRKWVQRHPAAAALLALLLVSAAAIGGLSVQGAIREERVTALEAGRARDRRQSLLFRAQFAIETGDLETSEEHLALALELDPTDPEPYLVRAAGYARYGRIEPARAAVAEAQKLGFTPDGPPSVSAQDHLYRGLYLLVQDDRALYEQAEEQLMRAIELDPALLGAYYPLYALRLNLGRENAWATLQALKDTRRLGVEFEPVVEALLLESRGDHAAALARLEPLREPGGLGPERFGELGLHRLLGRLHLKTGHPDRAEEHLRRAVEEFPDDDASWNNLALLSLSRGLTAEAEQFATRALEHDRSPDARRMLAWVAGTELEERIADPAARGPLMEAVETRLSELGEAFPGDPLLDPLEGQLCFLRGLLALDAGDRVLATEEFRRAVSLDPRLLKARVLLAEQLSSTERDRDALGQLEAALELWSEGSKPVVEGTGFVRSPWTIKWRYRIAVWTFRCALRAGDVARANAARRVLDAPEGVEGLADAITVLIARDPVQVVAYADMLANPPRVEDRDCARAIELLGSLESRPNVLSQAYLAQVASSLQESCP